MPKHNRRERKWIEPTPPKVRPEPKLHVPPLTVPHVPSLLPDPTSPEAVALAQRFLDDFLGIRGVLIKDAPLALLHPDDYRALGGDPEAVFEAAGISDAQLAAKAEARQAPRKIADEFDDGVEIVLRGRDVEVNLWYPNASDNIEAVEIDFTSVRSADAIRVFYDFPRDGWVVQMPHSTDADPYQQNYPNWVEVGFFDGHCKDERTEKL